MSLALAPLLVLMLAACQGTPAAPALSDPKEILTKSLTTLQDVKTFHVDADLSGKVNASLTGTGGGSQLDLAGTKGSLDVDVTGKKVHATGSLPALLNSSGELIVLPDALYYKITGPLAPSDKYLKMDVPPEATASDSPADPAKAISDLQAGLDKLPTPPTKLADEKCGDADCYHVQLKVTAADVSKLASAAPVTDFTNGDITLDVFTRKNDLRPAKFVASMSSAEMGSLSLTLTMTYDVSINVAAPPADQVQEGGGLTLPSFAP
jgi:hypothetical protein